jgi:hypothetical protein
VYSAVKGVALQISYKMHTVRGPHAEALAATMGITWDNEEQHKNKEMEVRWPRVVQASAKHL